MQWEQIPEMMDLWRDKVEKLGFDLRQVTTNVITGSHVGYYVHPDSVRIGIFAPLAADFDAKRVKQAAAAVTGEEPLFLSYQQLSDPQGKWVKVAHSVTLRRAGELLNFFPGQYTEGVPNHPSPLAAMLTSGVVGAGLGWGAGKLLGKVMPEGYGDRFGRTGMLIGGALGAAPGAMWGVTNALDNRSLNDPSLLNVEHGVQPFEYQRAADGSNAVWPPYVPEGNHLQETLEDVGHRLHNTKLPRIKLSADVQAIPLSGMYLTAATKVANTFGVADVRLGNLPTDVNIDTLGRTLWDTGASPGLTATTMAGMYAAQQMPDDRSQPGWVTGNQLGQLAANVAGDYAKGYLAGAAINAVVGTPHRAPVFGATGAVLGVLGAVVPKLFGR